MEKCPGIKNKRMSQYRSFSVCSWQTWLSVIPTGAFAVDLELLPQSQLLPICLICWLHHPDLHMAMGNLLVGIKGNNKRQTCQDKAFGRTCWNPFYFQNLECTWTSKALESHSNLFLVPLREIFFFFAIFDPIWPTQVQLGIIFQMLYFHRWRIYLPICCTPTTPTAQLM